jgi:hypothetical protein
MDLLTTYTHPSELQVIIALFLISTIFQITTAPAKPFPACYVFTSRSLATASNCADSSETATCLFTCCIAMAVLIICFKVFVKQRVYTPPYLTILKGRPRIMDHELRGIRKDPIIITLELYKALQSPARTKVNRKYLGCYNNSGRMNSDFSAELMLV